MEGFAAMAEAAGMPRKGMYTLREVSDVTGVPYATLLVESKAGRLESFLPKGRKRGIRVVPEWVDMWIAEGSGDGRQ